MRVGEGVERRPELAESLGEVGGHDDLAGSVVHLELHRQRVAVGEAALLDGRLVDTETPRPVAHGHERAPDRYTADLSLDTDAAPTGEALRHLACHGDGGAAAVVLRELALEGHLHDDALRQGFTAERFDSGRRNVHAPTSMGAVTRSHASRGGPRLGRLTVEGEVARGPSSVTLAARLENGNRLAVRAWDLSLRVTAPDASRFEQAI